MGVGEARRSSPGDGTRPSLRRADGPGEATPRPELASTGYCLANPGSEYLVYLPEGGEVKVDLSAAKGKLAVEWMHPITGQITPADPVEGGAKREFAAPFAGDAVLYLPRTELAGSMAMRIGIISDTHDHHRNVLRAVEIFAERGVECVLHAGDIVAPFTAKAFSELHGVKFIAVYGNNDGEKLFLRHMIEGFGGEIHEYCYKGELAGRKVYMTHTHHNVEEVAASQMYDLLVYGHTHQQDIRKVAGP